jgi:diacylglycerol kinase family enzyme
MKTGMDAPAERRRFVIVHNATAGRLGRKLVTRVVDALTRRGALVTLCDTATVADMATIGERTAAGVDAVVAAGGDGTIRALAKAVGPRLPIGIIPVGTGNVMANEIGLQRNADMVARTLAQGPVVEIEGGRANGEPFFLMAGAGFDGAVVGALNMALKQRLGQAAYVIPALRALAQFKPDLAVSIDGGEPRPAAWVVVTRAQHYGGSFTLTRRAGLRTPDLVAVLFRPRNRMQFVGQLLALAAGRLDRTADVGIEAGRRFEITSTAGAPTQLDGDVFATTPLVVEAGGPKIGLIVPREYLSAGPSRSASAR